MFVIFTTVSKPEDADKIANALIEKRLAACVQILPKMTSVYRWKGNVERDEEYLLLVKTVEENVKMIEAEFARVHPYETPEFVAVKAEYVAEPYLKWAIEATESK